VHHEVAALHPQGAAAGAEISRDDLHQGGLAGAVVAHQADDLTGFEHNRDIVQRVNAAEMFRDVLQLENRHPRPPAIFLPPRSPT
jgi:hypothetical protein